MVLGAAHSSFDFLFSGAVSHDWAARHCSDGEEMNDRQLIELVAKAAGLQEYGWMADTFTHVVNNQFVFWNPLEDDGDALRLSVRLGICYGPNFDNDLAVCFGREGRNITEPYGDDKNAATRRAIVRAAAATRKEMK